MKSFRLIYAAFVVLLFFSLATGCNKSDTAASNDNSSASGSGAGSPGSAGSKDADKERAKREAEERRITIPAGVSITVRTGETLSSKSSQPGQGFSATVARPVVVEGRTVIEEGAAAQGTVVDAKAMGHFKGGALLHVRLVSVTIKGKEYPVDTTATGGQLKGKGKRSAVAIGGGAGLGAILGGVFGGGKGAAIGAAAGAGAGTAGAAFTGNKEIVFPAETTLSFKLKAPVEVK